MQKVRSKKLEEFGEYQNDDDTLAVSGMREPIIRSRQPYLSITNLHRPLLCSMTLGRCRPSVQSIRCFPHAFRPCETLIACPKPHGRSETSKMTLFTPRAKSLLNAPVLENKIKKASGKGWGCTAQRKDNGGRKRSNYKIGSIIQRERWLRRTLFLLAIFRRGRKAILGLGYTEKKDLETQHQTRGGLHGKETGSLG